MGNRFAAGLIEFIQLAQTLDVASPSDPIANQEEGNSHAKPFNKRNDFCFRDRTLKGLQSQPGCYQTSMMWVIFLLVGVSWMLTGAMVFGLSYIYVRRFLSSVELPPLAVVTWQMGLALLMLFGATDLTGVARILDDWHAAVGLALGLGVFGTGISFLLYYFLLRELGAVAASGAIYITPIITLAIGWGAGEHVGLLDALAVSMIISSLVALEIGRQMTGKVLHRSTSVPSASFD